MSVASTEHMGTQSQSNFHSFSTTTQQTWVVSGLPAVSVNCIYSTLFVENDSKKSNKQQQQQI